jgi:hypothetical protein
MPSKPPPATPAEAFQIARDSDAPINERLAAYSAMVRAMGSPAYAIVDRLVERLKKAGAGLNAPAVGEPMPAFLLPDDAAHLVALEDLLAVGPVAIAFHRGHWCPYCRISEGEAPSKQHRLEARRSLIINRAACIAYRKKGIPARRSHDHPPRRPVSEEHLPTPAAVVGSIFGIVLGGVPMTVGTGIGSESAGRSAAPSSADCFSRRC